MKRFFLVEANTAYESLFCYELKETGLYRYEREAGVGLFNNIDRSQFFGNLSSLCITQERMKAPPIALAEPNLPSKPMPQHVQDVLDASVQEETLDAIAQESAQTQQELDALRKDAEWHA